MKTTIGKPPSFALTGQVPVSPRFRASRGITIATDAAVNRERARAGSGYIASSGLYGLAAHPQPAAIVGSDATTVAELRAIWRAVNAAGEDSAAAAQITILTDSEAAVRYLLAWQNGQFPPPPAGYQLRAQRASGKISSLEKLALVMREDGSRYTITKVAGHTGNLLNEAADSLAKLALRTGTRNGVTRSDAAAAAATIARFRLADYWETR